MLLNTILVKKMSIGANTTYFHGPLHTNRRNSDILHDPIWNKDLAFEVHERDRLGLRGLLPSAVQTIEQQIERCLRELENEPDDIHKNLLLSDLQNRNETLFNRLLADNVSHSNLRGSSSKLSYYSQMETIAPLVYTPTVGKVCQQFGFRFNRARGMYLSIDDRGLLSTLVHNWPHEGKTFYPTCKLRTAFIPTVHTIDVHIIVVTDGSRILGLVRQLFECLSNGTLTVTFPI